MAKKLQEVDKTTLCVFRRITFGLKFFQKFWAVLDFLRKIWHGSQTSIFVSREKIPEKIIFLLFFSDFFRSLSERLSDFRPKNFKKLSKLTSVCADEQFLAWNFFQNFWTVLDFLQKPLAWCSNFYLRVHSKNSGRNDFFNLLFIFFSDFERIFFRLSAKKLQEVFKTTFYVCRGTVCGLKFFLYFESFWTFWRNLWHGSQNSIYVFRVKIAEELIFLFFFSEFFRSLSERLSDFRPKNFKKLSKLPSAYADEQILAWEFFLKCFEPFWIFCRNLWHGSQNSIYVSRVKIAEEMVFFVFLFRIFFDFWAKIFQTFDQRTSRSWQNYPLRVQTNNFWLEIFFKILSRFGFSSENLAWFSNFYLRVQRKNSGRNNFFILLFRFFSEFERNFFFRFLAKKLQEVVKTNFCVCRRTFFGLGIFLKCFEPFWIFCRNLWHGSQNSIYVSRVKIAEEMVFFVFLFTIFFGVWAKDFQTFGQ